MPTKSNIVSIGMFTKGIRSRAKTIVDLPLEHSVYVSRTWPASTDTNLDVNLYQRLGRECYSGVLRVSRFWEEYL